MKYLFITGTGRSGTTLIEKILHNHPHIGVGSQPFPNLYFSAKSKFHQRRHLQRRYPLGHLFQESDYTFAELNRFLERCVFTDDDIAKLFDDMSRYNGQYMTDFLGFCRGQIVPGTFFNIFQQFLTYLAMYFGKEGLKYVGTKETWSEEFFPFLLDRKVKTIIIMRDPRDIITSFNFEMGVKHGGNRRPILYILRHWRKSVSFCLHYQEHPFFTWFKYEDLVKNSQSVLTPLTSFLDVVPYNDRLISRGIHDQQGDLWLGNSSFGNYSMISSASIARFKSRLSAQCIRYIESVCYPEFRMLGYEFEYCENGPDKEAIRDFQEPFPVTHGKFEPDYSYRPSNLDQEIQRLNRFDFDLTEDEQRKWFVFPKAYQMMKKKLEGKRLAGSTSI